MAVINGSAWQAVLKKGELLALAVEIDSVMNDDTESHRPHVNAYRKGVEDQLNLRVVPSCEEDAKWNEVESKIPTHFVDVFARSNIHIKTLI